MVIEQEAMAQVETQEMLISEGKKNSESGWILEMSPETLRNLSLCTCLEYTLHSLSAFVCPITVNLTFFFFNIIVIIYHVESPEMSVFFFEVFLWFAVPVLCRRISVCLCSLH